MEKAFHKKLQLKMDVAIEREIGINILENTGKEKPDYIHHVLDNIKHEKSPSKIENLFSKRISRNG